MQSKNEFWCKVVKTKTEILVAICDKNLVGEKIKVEKDFFIEIKENFYKERIINEEEAIKIMEQATILNIFGEKIVNLAIKMGLVSKENVIYFDGVPHAQFIKI